MGLGDFLGNLVGAHTDDVKPLVAAQSIGPNGEILGQQNQYVQSLQQQAAGNGPSAAGTMLQTAQDRSAANSNSLIAGRRGVNPGMAMRQAQYALAGSDQANAAAAAQARVGEQLGAQKMLGGQLNTMQGQDLAAGAANQAANMRANEINAGIAQGNTATNNQVAGGVLGGISGLFGMAASKAHGGYIHPKFAQHLASGGFAMMGTSGQGNPYADAFNFTAKKPGGGGGGGQISATEGYGPGSEAMAGGPMDAVGGAMDELGPAMLLASDGGKVPGKAIVSGDSPKNDFVHTMLSPDELVIPRTISTRPKFVEALEKIVQAMPGDGPQGFAKVLAARKGRA